MSVVSWPGAPRGRSRGGTGAGSARPPVRRPDSPAAGTRKRHLWVWAASLKTKRALRRTPWPTRSSATTTGARRRRSSTEPPPPPRGSRPTRVPTVGTVRARRSPGGPAFSGYGIAELSLRVLSVDLAVPNDVGAGQTVESPRSGCLEPSLAPAQDRVPAPLRLEDQGATAVRGRGAGVLTGWVRSSRGTTCGTARTSTEWPGRSGSGTGRRS